METFVSSISLKSSDMNITKIDVKDFRNLIIVGLAIIAVFMSYFVIADTASDHYVQVDQDIWSFLKYIGVVFLGLLIYIGRELVVALKAIVTNMIQMNLAFTESKGHITEIKNDVAEIKDIQKDHASRLTKIEANRVN